MVYGSRRRYCSLCVMLSGLALVVAMVVCVAAGVFTSLIKRKIEENVKLKEGSETFKNWKSPSSPVYMQYFMFNLTNAHDVQNGSSRPSVKQIGPYSYRETRHNVPRYFNYSTDTIVYFSQKAYVFDSATSCAGCDPVLDKVYTINIPLLQISRLIGMALNKFAGLLPSAFAPMILKQINAFLNKEKIFHYKSVHELLWGYEDYILATLGNFTALLNKQLEEHGFKFHIPPLNSYVQLQTNNSNTSAEIHTGVGNIDRLGQYVSWNNFRILPWWYTKWANMINGTDASMFPPFVSKDDRLNAFVSDVCRSIYLIYDSTIEVRGITLYRFFSPPEVFKYTADARAGFCAPNSTCVPDGLLDISVCQPLRVPIVISLPHFLFANESVVKSVDGMHPNKEDHAPFVSVEPNTGLTMKANKRIQINVAVDKVDNITQLEKLRKVYLPVLFVNESAEISEDDAEKFKHDVILPKELISIGKYVLIGVGCLMMIIGLFLLRMWNKRVGYKEPSVQAHSFNDEEHDEKSPLTGSAQNYVT